MIISPKTQISGVALPANQSYPYEKPISRGYGVDEKKFQDTLCAFTKDRAGPARKVRPP
jgi:hypothetical protein